MVKKVWQTDGRTDGQTDRRTDRQTDWTIHRAAWSQLKNSRDTEKRQTAWAELVNRCSSYHIHNNSKIKGFLTSIQLFILRRGSLMFWKNNLKYIVHSVYSVEKHIMTYRVDTKHLIFIQRGLDENRCGWLLKKYINSKIVLSYIASKT